MKKNRCEVCGKPSYNKLCGWHLGNHDPVPEHHVAAERTCLRCGEGFESSWAGDRICDPCRQREYWAEKDAIKRGHTSAHYDSPLEPHETPALV